MNYTAYPREVDVMPCRLACREWSSEGISSVVWWHLRKSALQSRQLPTLNPLAAKLLLTEAKPKRTVH